MKENHTDDMESRIIFVAQKMFIEKGFTETSMSDIAAQVGINRPGLHYYFRTKERMFQAVFGQIVLSFLPEIKDIMIQQNVPFDKRIENIIDAYYGKICKENPDLPLFMIREINRDVNHLLLTIKELGLLGYTEEIATSIGQEMNNGSLKKIPLRTVFLTFYGLLIMPWLTRNLTSAIFLDKNESFDDFLTKWKVCIVMQMKNLVMQE